jgi:hypothetical protein
MIHGLKMRLSLVAFVVLTYTLGCSVCNLVQAQEVTPGSLGGTTSVEPADEAGTTATIVSDPVIAPAPTPPSASKDPVSPSPSYSNTTSTPTIQEQVREARRKGYILPYSVVLTKLNKSVSGKVIKVWLDKHGGRYWSYEFVVLQDSGQMLRISMLANTAKISGVARR